jgi:hypothetical protein
LPFQIQIRIHRLSKPGTGLKHCDLENQMKIHLKLKKGFTFSKHWDTRQAAFNTSEVHDRLFTLFLMAFDRMNCGFILHNFNLNCGFFPINYKFGSVSEVIHALIYCHRINYLGILQPDPSIIDCPFNMREPPGCSKLRQPFLVH